MPQPTHIGKYQILDELGRGGFATVYKALDPTLDRTVALKVLHPQLTIDPKFIQRFYQEARTAAGLHHSNIVTIYEVGEEEGQHYLAMEFLSGQPLSKLVENGPLPVEQAASILEQIAEALDAVHKQGLVHRDVKPGNILVDDAGQATLLDFGIVRAAEGTRLTTTMAVLGTPEYMAPEQAEIEEAIEIDWRVDIYALGVVTYEVLVGRPPFIGTSPTGILYKHIHEPPPTPTTLNPALPSDLEPILLKTLAKKRDERYQSAREMAHALRHAIQSKASAQQREQRLVELYVHLQQAVKDQNWPTAEAHCREILALDLEYRDVSKLWEQVQEARARQRELEELYEEAQTKAKGGAWAEVKDLCQRTNALEPSYRDTSELLKQAREALSQDRARKDQEARLAQLYEQARTALQQRRWEEVRQHCADIEALAGPGYRDADELLMQAKIAVQQEQTRREVWEEAERQKKLSRLYAQAQAAQEAEDWEGALSALEELLTESPDFKGATALLKAVKTQRDLAETGQLHHAGQQQNAVNAFARIVASSSPLQLIMWFSVPVITFFLNYLDPMGLYGSYYRKYYGYGYPEPLHLFCATVMPAMLPVGLSLSRAFRNTLTRSMVFVGVVMSLYWVGVPIVMGMEYGGLSGGAGEIWMPSIVVLIGAVILSFGIQLVRDKLRSAVR